MYSEARLPIKTRAFFGRLRATLGRFCGSEGVDFESLVAGTGEDGWFCRCSGRCEWGVLGSDGAGTGGCGPDGAALVCFGGVGWDSVIG